MWAMHLPRARINAPRDHHGSRARISWFWFLAGRGRLFRRRRAERSSMQLQPNRGNLYDGAFNRSIKTVLRHWTKPKWEDRWRVPRRSPIFCLFVTYTIISEYLVQGHRKYIAWTLRARFTSQHKRELRLLTTDIFLDKAIQGRYSDNLAKSAFIYAFGCTLLLLMNKPISIMFLSRYVRQFLAERNPLACSWSARDTRCQIVTRLFDTEKGDTRKRKHLITTSPPLSRTPTTMRVRAVKHAKD